MGPAAAGPGGRQAGSGGSGSGGSGGREGFGVGRRLQGVSAEDRLRHTATNNEGTQTSRQT
eukprot:2002164-Rhodomonas_salina.1